jgi:protein SCO1
MMNIRNLMFVALVALSPLLAGCQTHRTDACPDCAATAAGENTNATATSAFSTQWLAPEERKAVIPAFAFENQDGNKVSLTDFRGSPVALSFIYTRCQNERKCPLVARTMAQLAQSAAAVSPAPRVLLMSYDPEFDTPAHLKTFAGVHGFACTENAMLLRPEVGSKEQLIKSLNVPVNYNQAGVNLHGIQLVLLDKQGRMVRNYHSLLWNNEKVLADLTRLAAE